jgi:monoamine oxidase
MLETAIVGGGLCGLALARGLSRRAEAFQLFEARPRLGGRILTVAGPAGAAADLGPSWFWPKTQPAITRLVSDLGLADFPQHDDGAVLHLRDPDKAPDSIAGHGLRDGARRLKGGMAKLVDALAGELPSDRIHLGHELRRVTDRGAHVVLTFVADGQTIEVEARRVVLALPPRLLAEHVRFEPELDEATREAMRGTETWMAAQAKVVVFYRTPVWREQGRSGNAFVAHEQAVVAEIFDACDATGEPGALGGFLAFSPALRQTFEAGLPMLMASQMVQVFGAALEQQQLEQHYQDWAAERFTCSGLDRDERQGNEHLDVASPFWDGRLHLGGAEPAARAAGYLEGALDAARRIGRALARTAAPAALDDVGGDGDNASSGNAASLLRFNAWVGAQGDIAFDRYRQALHRSLSGQQRDQLTQLAVLNSIEAVFADALKVLDELSFDVAGIAVERGRSALTPEIQKPFREFIQSFVDDFIAFNRTSCALSNFPDEHRPSKEYVQTIMRDIAAAWQEFSLAANRLLVAKADAGLSKVGSIG